VEMAGVAVESSANEQSWILHEIGKMPGVETICETGFKAGHNTFMYVLYRPNRLTMNYNLLPSFIYVR
jgi:hypothetical protein